MRKSICSHILRNLKKLSGLMVVTEVTSTYLLTSDNLKQHAGDKINWIPLDISNHFCTSRIKLCHRLPN